MKTTILLSLMIATTAFAGGPGPEDQPKNQCYQKTITVCPLKKKKKKPAAVLPAVAPTVVEKEVIVEKEVLVEVERVTTVEKLVEKPCPEKKKFFTGALRAAVGGGLMGPYHSGLVGLRLKVPSWRSGLDLYTAFNYGHGVSYLFYTFQGERLQHHVNLGVIGGGGSRLSALDVPRTWDVTVGTGLEYRLVGPLSATADLRTSFTNPVFIANNAGKKFDADGNQVYGEEGKYLDVKHVLGNSFGATQLMLGLMLEF